MPLSYLSCACIAQIDKQEQTLYVELSHLYHNCFLKNSVFSSCREIPTVTIPIHIFIFHSKHTKSLKLYHISELYENKYVVCLFKEVF